MRNLPSLAGVSLAVAAVLIGLGQGEAAPWLVEAVLPFLAGVAERE